LGGRTTKGPKQDSQHWLKSTMHDGDEPWLHYLETVDF